MTFFIYMNVLYFSLIICCIFRGFYSAKQYLCNSYHPFITWLPLFEHTVNLKMKFPLLLLQNLEFFGGET